MSTEAITIEEVAKCEYTWQRVVRFGAARSLETPAQVVLIGGPSDLRPLVERRDLEAMPQGLAASLGAAAILPPSMQSVLPGYTLGEHNYEALRSNVPVLFDPDTDLFYDGRTDDREHYARLPGLPHGKAVQALKTDSYNGWWNRLDQDGKLLTVLMWNARFQVKAGADAILPYAPYLDGESVGLADLAVAANTKTRTLVSDMKPGHDAAYYNFHPNAFRRPTIGDKVLDALESDLEAGTPPKLFVVKVTQPNGNDAVINYRIRNFFARLTELKEVGSLAGTPFAVGFIGQVGRGKTMVFGGVDFFIEPFGPSSRYGRAKKGQAPPRHGRYYHPGPQFYDFVGFEELQDLYEANNRALPCPCAACETVAGVGLPIHDEDEWNALRRVHFVNARRRELEAVVRAVRDGTTMDAVDWVGRSNNAHFGAWLPRHFV